MTITSSKEIEKQGTLFKNEAATVCDISGHETLSRNVAKGVGDSLAFAGLYVFTFLLYSRPNELLPGIFGAFPVIKIVALVTALTYGVSRLNADRPITIWPLEVRMLLLMVVLAVLFMPF